MACCTERGVMDKELVSPRATWWGGKTVMSGGVVSFGMSLLGAAPRRKRRGHGGGLGGLPAMSEASRSQEAPAQSLGTNLLGSKCIASAPPSWPAPSSLPASPEMARHSAALCRGSGRSSDSGCSERVGSATPCPRELPERRGSAPL